MARTPTVLLVDDDTDYLFQQRMKMTSLNFEVFEASTVEDAIAIAKANTIDLAIIDLMMDEMDDGFVLAHHLKRINPDLPVIMTTAVTSVTGYQFHKDSPKEKGWIKADVILPKPVRLDQLKAELKKLGYSS